MNFDDCIKNELVKKHKFNDLVIKKELFTANKFLKKAEKIILIKDNESAALAAYLAMFHFARAYVYKNGFKEKSHFCVFQYLIDFEKKLSDLGAKGQYYRYLRELVQYEGNDIDHKVAKQMISCAKEFKKEIESRIIL